METTYFTWEQLHLYALLLDRGIDIHGVDHGLKGLEQGNGRNRLLVHNLASVRLGESKGSRVDAHFLVDRCPVCCVGGLAQQALSRFLHNG